MYWRKRTTSTFRLPAQPLREKGWKELYRNLATARLYSWGSNGQGRLGHPRLENGLDYYTNFNYPTEVRDLPNEVVVDIVGGYVSLFQASFYLLCSHIS